MEIVLFRIGTREDLDQQQYERAFEHMLERVSQVAGFVSVEAFAGEDGSELAVARFTSREAIAAWRDDPEHVRTRERGREEFFASYETTLDRLAAVRLAARRCRRRERRGARVRERRRAEVRGRRRARHRAGDSLFDQGHLLWQMGRPEDARDIFDTFINRCPNHYSVPGAREHIAAVRSGDRTPPRAEAEPATSPTGQRGEEQTAVTSRGVVQLVAWCSAREGDHGRLLSLVAEQGPHVALGKFMTMLVGADWCTLMGRRLPGSMQQMRSDARTFFEADLPALFDWRVHRGSGRTCPLSGCARRRETQRPMVSPGPCARADLVP